MFNQKHCTLGDVYGAFRNMSNSVVYKKQFETSSACAATLLKSLNSLYGCAYLAQQQSPVIGVLPCHYFVANESSIDHFQRDDTQTYHHSSKLTALPPHVNFKQLSNNTADQSFSGGYIGFIDYNYAAAQHVDSPTAQQPNLYLGCYLSYLKLEDGIWYFYSQESQPEARFEFLQDHVTSHEKNTAITLQLRHPCRAVWNKDQYNEAFERIHDYIRAGDCYQINLTQKFSAHAQGQLIDIAKEMWELTEAPYSAYLKLDDFELLSCSPELFIEFAPERQLITKPIKGTMPRHADPVLDQRSKQSLIDSEKDQAENLMIVDLLRNDLSVYAEIGSVKTPKLFEIESFNQVHHMVSEVTATLKADTHPLDILLSALPGGSITGAPKIRAMQIIQELEVGPRGAYCGSMGYFNLDGTGCWNILIRSLQKSQDELNLWAGGGVTIASNRDAEYQECLDKVSAMLDLLNTRYTP